tara:strand:- start:2469 stop:2723 length:255 start_codon:yes stop_codon:yes gene_type:complete
MPSYVKGGDFTCGKVRLFDPSNSPYMKKEKVVKKVISFLNGAHRRRQLEKAFAKLNIDEVIMIGMLTEKLVDRKVEEALKDVSE